MTEDEAFFLVSGGGVTLSGGEPLLQDDFCAALLKALKSKNIHTAVDTCGAVGFAAFEKVLPYTDVFLYDVKAVDEGLHIACTGVTNRQIPDNLARLGKLRIPVEVRIPLVPDMNDADLPAIGKFLAGISSLVKIRVLAYHPYAAGKFRGLGMRYPAESVAPPSRFALESAKRIIGSFVPVPVLTE